MKKWLLMVGLLLVLSIPFAAADITSTLGNVWDKVIGVGNLSFIGGSDAAKVVGLTRLLIWILCFTLFFAVITMIGKQPMSFFSRSQAMVVAGVVATIAAIFLPADVLLATGAAWATAVALLLIGGPIVGLGVLLIKYPGKGKETRATVLIKLVLCLLMFWILSAVKFHIGQLGGIRGVV